MKAELIDLVYAAGFIEADGCFHLTNTSIGIRATNKNLTVLNWFKDTYGGEISSKVSPTNCWDWNLHGYLASELCEDLLPYLKFKRRQAEVLIEFYSTIGVRGRRTEDEVIELRNELRQEMWSLKHES